MQLVGMTKIKIAVTKNQLRDINFLGFTYGNGTRDGSAKLHDLDLISLNDLFRVWARKMTHNILHLKSDNLPERSKRTSPRN